jgi:hypothetical protein
VGKKYDGTGQRNLEVVVRRGRTGNYSVHHGHSVLDAPKDAADSKHGPGATSGSLFRANLLRDFDVVYPVSHIERGNAGI